MLANAKKKKEITEQSKKKLNELERKDPPTTPQKETLALTMSRKERWEKLKEIKAEWW